MFLVYSFFNLKVTFFPLNMKLLQENHGRVPHTKNIGRGLKTGTPKFFGSRILTPQYFWLIIFVIA